MASSRKTRDADTPGRKQRDTHKGERRLLLNKLQHRHQINMAMMSANGNLNWGSWDRERQRDSERDSTYGMAWRGVAWHDMALTSSPKHVQYIDTSFYT